MNLSVRKFVESIGARSSAPGGGSAAACIASIVRCTVTFVLSHSTPCFQGAGLGTMVGLLTYGNKKFEHLDGVMRTSIAPLYAAMTTLLPQVDADSKAFSQYMVNDM